MRRSTAPRSPEPPPSRRARYEEDTAEYDEYSPPREPRSSRSSDAPARRSSQSAPNDEYVERVRRGSSRYEDDYDAAPSSRDPYDRLRRSSPTRPSRRAEPEYDADDYLDEDFEEFDGRPERRRNRQRAGAGTMAAAAAGTATMRRMGSKLANPAADQRAVVMGALSLVASLVLMLIVIAIRYGSAPDWLPVDLDAEGSVVMLGTKSVIWRLPVFALFSSVMALGLGWWLRMREPFAAEFLAISALMINGIIWVGIITLLW